RTKNRKTDRGRPPFVKFVWGQNWSFRAVIQSISQRFTLFLPDGTPVRAIMDVTFLQMEEASLKQNPTSGGGPEVKWYVVRPGDTLASIAYAEYHNPNLWRRIADQNSLENPLVLMPGQELQLPPLD
ncbi:MAG: Peptidoglycan-binding LysM, partial [Armatimonadetes bacterium]|nr:Peptidoglycan-binding LysM [Armatimonadota bacterium]